MKWLWRLFLLSLATGNSHASIVTVPDATIFYDVSGGTPFVGPFPAGSQPVTFLASSIQGTSMTSFTYSGGKGSVSASADAVLGNLGSPGGGYLDYRFEVVGPSDIEVPLVFSANGNASLTLTGDQTVSQSQVVVYADVTGVHGFDITPFLMQLFYTPGSQSFDTSENGFSIPANTIGDVQLFIAGSAQVGNFPGNAASFSAFVDPSVSIDSSFALPGYSLVFSADPAVGTVPEPGTLALVGLGVAGLAASRRGRQ